MTPDERLNRIEATLDRAARMYEKMVVRQVGIRIMYRQGVRRMEDMMDRMDHQDKLLEALIDSQIKTEETTRRAEEAVASLAESVKKLVERTVNKNNLAKERPAHGQNTVLY
jgi:hypothetical protein